MLCKFLDRRLKGRHKDFVFYYDGLVHGLYEQHGHGDTTYNEYCVY